VGLALWHDREDVVSAPEDERVEAGLAGIRRAVQTQLGVGRLETADVDSSEVVRFRGDLPSELSDARRTELLERVEELQPWLQGPFLLGGDLVVGGAWRNDQRWTGLGERLGDIAGQRVLDVGSNAGYDPFMFNVRGASEVVGCEPWDFYEQALFLQEIYGTSIDFRRIGWQQLSSDELGRFDLVHCHGVLYHELNPMAMLSRLHEMTADGGTLLLGSMMLADPALSDHVRFVSGSYYGDPTWWWVPGQLALRRMIAVAGFDVTGAFGLAEGPPGEFATVNGYIEAVRSERGPAVS
jgi:SAM-dependent methyltransferase